MTQTRTITWVREKPDLYVSDCGRWHIVRTAGRRFLLWSTRISKYVTKPTSLTFCQEIAASLPPIPKEKESAEDEHARFFASPPDTAKVIESEEWPGDSERDAWEWENAHSPKIPQTEPINLGIRLEGKSVYLTPSGVRLARGPVRDVSVQLSLLSKSEGRKLRKAIRKHGHHHLAGTKRFPIPF